MNYNPYYYQPQMMQSQNNGLVSVRGINEARNYPVAAGNSVTFKDETAPYIYTKTMGFSQLDRPSFEVFRLVKEDVTQEAEPVDVDLKKEVEKLKNEVEKLKAMIEKEADYERSANDTAVF